MAETEAVRTAGPVRLPAVPEVGTPVEVRNRYVGSWAPGFEVAAQVPGGLVVRRLSDGAVLGEPVAHDEVRPVLGPTGW